MRGNEEKFGNASLHKEVSTRVFSELNINPDGICRAESGWFATDYDQPVICLNSVPSSPPLG